MRYDRMSRRWRTITPVTTDVWRRMNWCRNRIEMALYSLMVGIMVIFHMQARWN